MNLEDFQARFDAIFQSHKHENMYGPIYLFRDKDMEELYNICLEGMGEL